MEFCCNHPERETSVICNRCDSPICKECQIRINGLVICPDCDMESDSKKESLFWGIIGVLTLLAINSASYFVFFFTGNLIHTTPFNITLIVGSSLLFAALIQLSNEYDQNLFVISGLLIFLHSLFSFTIHTPTEPESLFLGLSSTILYFIGFIILGRAFLAIYPESADPKLTRLLGRYLVLFSFAWIVLSFSLGLVYLLSITLSFILLVIGYVLLLIFFMKVSEERKPIQE
ncbi:MAG: hypothetical protein GF411_15955 [Candidatus Lokiarchaeota archaeon]|nr:hypothetical protein [Candidatus Lokiarchaeota archaeon]